ncbi:MqnA/MqnD/SBP family protein [Hydrogenimonas sp.]
MIFGKIEYLNLLPFHMFLKRRLKSSGEKGAWSRHGSVPSRINRAFLARRIDAAVISSIKSRRCRCTDLGIVADGAVQSVLLLPGKSRNDSESDTSNVLAKVLGLEGEVIIGDKALHYYHTYPDRAIDLAAAWKEREGLPFVFARLCAHPPHFSRIEKLSREFLANPPKIPAYILKRQAALHGVAPDDVKAYLELIYYRIGWREKRALKRFFRLASRANR